MTKLQRLFKKAHKMNDRDYGTHELFRESIYELGRECFIKILQSKLLEVKYDGKVIKIDEEELK